MVLSVVSAPMIRGNVSSIARSGSSGTVRVALISDSAYVMPTAVTIASLEDKLPPLWRLEVALVGDQLSSDDAAKISQTLDPERTTVVECPVPGDLRPDIYPMSQRLNKEHSASVWLILHLAELVPPHWNRVLYLDSDIVACASVTELWLQDLGGQAIGAVQDGPVPTIRSEFGLPDWRALSAKGNEQYFNSGVLLIDLERWRARNIPQIARAYIGAREDLVQYDQEVLNWAFFGDWYALDKRWNVTGWWLHDENRVGRDSDILLSVGLFHFAGRSKPWKSGHKTNTFVDEFYAMLDKTAWAGWRPAAGATED
ncbi:glycosyltransferase family 8 protein [Curtobacterium oceanosedimentum]|uniref:glycosyltransferase family 8 protein n=1 Tax=Curtobacterium oceanosedimentum TaxID=465820 RepID=UPI00128F5FEA|nr:glycosyltransferase family 8 protein [Curtobacterium oceanosedimentum]